MSLAYDNTGITPANYKGINNPDYITSKAKDTYKPKQVPSSKLSSVNPREITFKTLAKDTSRVSPMLKALPIIGTEFLIADVFSDWGTQWYKDKIVSLEKQGYDIVKDGTPLQEYINSQQQTKTERKPLTDNEALPNHGVQKDIPNYKKEQVVEQDTLLSIMRGGQGLQNHDMSMIATELVAQSEIARTNVAVQAHIAQILDAQTIVASESYGVQREQYNAMSSIHKVLDNSMIAHVEMMGQLTDVVRDLVSATNKQFKATDAVAYQTANVANASARTNDELAVKSLEKTKLEYQTTQTTIQDLDGETVANKTPLELEAISNATKARKTTDENNFELDDSDFDIFPLDVDLTEILTPTLPSQRYASYYSPIGGA